MKKFNIKKSTALLDSNITIEGSKLTDTNDPKEENKPNQHILPVGTKGTRFVIETDDNWDTNRVKSIVDEKLNLVKNGFNQLGYLTTSYESIDLKRPIDLSKHKSKKITPPPPLDLTKYENRIKYEKYKRNEIPDSIEMNKDNDLDKDKNINKDATKLTWQNLFNLKNNEQIYIHVEKLYPGAPAHHKFKIANFYLVEFRKIKPHSFSFGKNILDFGKTSLVERTNAISNDKYYFDIAYLLKKECAVLNVFPDVFFHNDFAIASSGGLYDKEAPLDKAWSLRKMRVDQAPLNNRGQGVLIGHIDTGWTEHKELNLNICFDLNKDKNIVTNINDASDPWAQTTFSNPGHGTSTASIMISQGSLNTTFSSETIGSFSSIDEIKCDGTTDGDGILGGIVGVAPNAKIVSVKAVDDVLITGEIDIARAVWYCVQQNVDVISMSLGGVCVPFLQDVCDFANYVKNIIIVAAAGNWTPFVVAPASYESVIGVAATDNNNNKWLGSAPLWPSMEELVGFSLVNVSAPGHNVWRATWENQKGPVRGRAVVAPSSGTSYATANVAGVAALWLSHFGKTNMISLCGDTCSLSEIFTFNLEKTVQPFGSNSGEFLDIDLNKFLGIGKGVVDVSNLLFTSPTNPYQGSFLARMNQIRRKTYFEVLAEMFPMLENEQKAIEIIAKTFNISEEEAKKKIEENGLELVAMLVKEKKSQEAFIASMKATKKAIIETATDKIDEFIETAKEAAKTVIAVIKKVASAVFNAIFG